MRGRGRRLSLLLVTALATALAVNTVLVNRRTKPAKADIGHIVRLPGGDLQVRADGNPRNTPLVLLHGFDASMRWWDRATPALARDHNVIRFDLLGHGGSAKPAGGYSMEAQADRVGRVLRKAGVRNAIVAGHSMGANVAVALAARHPGLVRGIVIIDQEAKPGEGKLGLTARLGFVPVIGQLLWGTAPDFAVRDGLSIAFAKGFHVPDRFIGDYRRMTYTAYHDSGNADGDFVKARHLDDRAAATHKPVLVIFGDRDQLVPPRTANDFRDIPGVQIRFVHGAGHSPMFEKPAQTAALILDFARRLEPQRNAFQ